MGFAADASVSGAATSGSLVAGTVACWAVEQADNHTSMTINRKIVNFFMGYLLFSNLNIFSNVPHRAH
jgi:hypothetical protein